MIVQHGGRGLAGAAVTWTAAKIAGGGDLYGAPEVIAAVISALAAVGIAVGAPLFLDWYRRRRKVDHIAEVHSEQSDLANRLMTELEKVRGELEWERRERKKAERQLADARGPGGNQHRRTRGTSTRPD